MPSSDLTGKPVVSDWLKKHPEIKTIVDLGPGAATYAKLMEGNYVWKAVEVWAPYLEEYQLEKYYDEVRIGDIRYTEFPEGDCCIAGDILEHLGREDFIKVFRKIDKQFGFVVIAVPVNFLADETENPFEKHQSYWSIDEMDKLFVGYEKVVVDPCVYYFKEPK